MDKGTQVSIGAKRKLKSNKGCQTLVVDVKNVSSQCGSSRGSYSRNSEHKQWTYDDLVREMMDKETFINWLIGKGVLKKTQHCPRCSSEMKLVQCCDRSDGYRWECNKQIQSKRHRVELSIRSGKLV